MAELLPPQSPDAERSVLGSLLRDNAVISEVAAILTAENFYADAHRQIFRAILALAENGSAVDLVTLADYLHINVQLDNIGGYAYLAELWEAAPTAANVDHYAAIVRDRALLRGLIHAGTEILRDAYEPIGAAEEAIEAAQQRIFALAQDQRPKQAIPLSAAINEAADRFNARCLHPDDMAGIPTGFVDLDKKTSGLHDGELTLVAGRPTIGKSSLALSIVRNVLVGSGLPVFFVSLEMSHLDLAECLWSMDATVDSQHLRRISLLEDGETQRLAESRGRLAQLPFFITPDRWQTMTRIASEARRLKLRHGIRLLVIDYLQLIASERRGDRKQYNREQEVADISRRLKCLAGELSVPVICLAQLNRESEHRTDRKPRLSDLRECLAGDQVIHNATTGFPCTVRQLLGAGPLPISCLDDSYRLQSDCAIACHSTGIKSIFRLRTRSGRVLRCSAEHRLRTIDGWQELRDLAPGIRIAVPRFLPEPIPDPDNTEPLTIPEARLLGYLISDGTYLKHRSVGYVKADLVCVDEVRRIALERFGIVAKDHACKGKATQIELTAPQQGPGGNPLMNWLRSLRIHGQLGHQKRVPAELFACPNRTVADFVGALWAGDGTVVKRPCAGWVLKFVSSSMGLLDDLQTLLLRLGILSSISGPQRCSKSKRDLAILSIHDASQILAFAAKVSIPGIKGEKLIGALPHLRMLDRNARLDRLPLSVTDEVATAKTVAGHSWTTLGYRAQGKEICREDLEHVAKVLDNDRFRLLATSDVLWDQILSITPDGEEETFDLSVPGLNNLVVGNIFAHNSGSLEQDADTVILLHRLENSDHVEVLIEKQRNGPVGKVLLAFEKPYRRYVDAASGNGPF